MISYKPLQESNAFRLWCKAKELNFEEYNEVGKNLDQYRDDEYWGEIIKDSSRFVGVVESIAPSPCSMLVYDKNVVFSGIDSAELEIFHECLKKINRNMELAEGIKSSECHDDVMSEIIGKLCKDN